MQDIIQYMNMYYHLMEVYFMLDYHQQEMLNMLWVIIKFYQDRIMMDI
jgi:hypothetical protein